jgi:1-acyl-sn-glycerol-3-phosphate acyltransferase
MKNIGEELQTVKLGSEYDYLGRSHCFSSSVKRTFKVWLNTQARKVSLTSQNTDKIPTDSSYILTSNHTSHIDSCSLALTSRGPFEDCGMVVAKDYFHDVLWRRWTLGNAFTLIPIRRKPSFDEMVEDIAACKKFVEFRNTRRLVMFPEGTRSETGEMGPLKKGIAMYALALNIPIVPSHIEGAYKAWPKGQSWAKAHPVDVAYGDPVYPLDYITDEELSKNRTYKAYTRITSELESRIKKLKRDYHD